MWTWLLVLLSLLADLHLQKLCLLPLDIIFASKFETLFFPLCVCVVFETTNTNLLIKLIHHSFFPMTFHDVTNDFSYMIQTPRSKQQIICSSA
jgi:hypothetical protein